MYLRSGLAFLTVVFLGTLVGCGDSGPPMGTVSGTVTMDGEPLNNATVSFVPSSGGRPASGKTDAQGKYELYTMGKQGAMVGSHKVVIRTIMEPIEAASSSMAEMSSDDPNYANQGSSDSAKAKRPEDPIPAKYNKESTLTKDVASGSQTFDFELTSS